MKLGVIGCGKMGTALIQGAIRAGVVAAEDVFGCDPYEKSRDAFSTATGAKVTAELAEIVAVSEVLLLCTKPLDVPAALAAAAKSAAGSPKLVISIAAGLTLSALEAAASENFRIIRAMPNTPALVGHGAAGYCLGSRATAIAPRRRRPRRGSPRAPDGCRHRPVRQRSGLHLCRH
jgi:pyrroline-5-carboxylate reductase